METASGLVRELLLLSLIGFAPILLLAAFIGVLLVITRLRGPQQPKPASGRSTFQSADGQRIVRRMRRNKQPSLFFATADQTAFSKLGGAPDLPAELGWPEGPSGQLRFLCQIDLAEARASGGPEWLPEDGRLYAFHSEDNGAADQVRILYAPTAGPLSARAARDPSAWPYEERAIMFCRRDSLPSLDWLDEDVRTADVGEQELGALVELSEPGWNEPLHKLGGYPDELQDEQMAVTCEIARGSPRDDDRLPSAAAASRTWRLLLQIDSDPLLGTDFGGGRFYVFIRMADAKQARFDQTVTLSQTD